MKKLVFLEMLLLSQFSKKSKKIIFDENFNIVVWKNSTGKSSLLKSIYSTFWAEPYTSHEKWKNENVISFIKFKITDNINTDFYSILKNWSTFTIFDSNDNKIETFTSITKWLWPYLNILLDFRIKINNRQNEIVWLNPNYLFLPYYIDQDISWTTNWSSFSKLQQFSRWKQKLVEFYIWIKPNEFYDIKWIIDINNNKLSEKRKEKTILDNLKINIDTKFPNIKEYTNVKDFTDEINDLLKEMNTLSSEKNKYTNEVNNLNSQKITILEQINITSISLREAKANYDFIMKDENELKCPICWNKHTNTFKEKFELAKDEDTCNLLLLSLKEELKNIEEKLSKTINKYNILKEKFEKINKIIIQKKSDTKLIDIIKTEWKKELKTIFINEQIDLNKKIDEIVEENKKLDKKLKIYINRKRVKEIKDDYKKIIEGYFKDLDVSNISEKSYKKVDSNIIETWSNLPRALISYYMTILKLIAKNNSSSFCPIVIDSPNQQWQDDSHLPMILKFIINNSPSNSQVILWIEDTCNLDFPWKTIELKTINSLLQEENYEENYSYLNKYLNNSLK